MLTLFKLNLMYFILYVIYGQINSKSIIIEHRPDSGGTHDNVNAVAVNALNENEVFNLNNHYYELLSTVGTLEQSIVPAEVIELTTPTINSSKNVNSSPTSAAAETDPEDNSLNINDFESMLYNINGDDGYSCLLDDIKAALLWWTFTNGTLRHSNLNTTPIVHNVDLSYQNISHDQELYQHIQSLENQQIVAFSAAHNNLSSVPKHTLKLMRNSLKYLTLTGNQFIAKTESQAPENYMEHLNHGFNFHDNLRGNHLYCNFNKKGSKFLSKNAENVAWATFPILPNLIELDISNCRIEYVTKTVFQNLTNLERLYMSHNKILTVPYDTFTHVPSLEYLDLSFINVLDNNDELTLNSLDAFYNLMYGVNIQPTTFENLLKLVYLDLSHTKLTRNSTLAFTHLGDQLRYLSLCYTAFPMLGNAIFKNTALEALDLSGNIFAASNILDDAFEGLSNTLKYLLFERSNLKEAGWLKHLKNLNYLGLAGNNLHSLSVDMFSPLSSLQVLDLSSNQVGNWYNRVFVNNPKLRVLGLRDNSLNMITNEMLRDFSPLEYISLGDNDFVCDCRLREIHDVSVKNQNETQCSGNDAHEAIKRIAFNKTSSVWNNRSGQIDIPLVLWQQQFKQLKNQKNWRKLNLTRKKLKMRFLSHHFPKQQCARSEPDLATYTPYAHAFDKFNETNFKFQLFDYEEDHYWCFNETEKLNFIQMQCQKQTIADDIAEQIQTLTTYIIVCVAFLIGATLIGFLIYWKRWYIHYYYTTLKTASIMSAAVKENHNKLNSLSNDDPNTVYDIFISYCEHDRDWILEELIPNVEETEDISICLHERDFQIGVTIIDNIVSCMERSRALMLIVSSDFLLSHWCQFEMQLAQHRIFDVSKEHLILVFLEDIPRSKRPRHLQYLMDVKTYIKWPGGKHRKGVRVEDRKLFWKRLKRSLSSMGLHPTESSA